ncbi:hypothetical protein EDB19DRAFT_1850040 [Suillus lakei]|nr:hypothetical protein EDB19DRAFT_1850040 [Suillus lakei]
MRCNHYQSAWYCTACTPEHLQSDRPCHRKECVPATHTPNYNIIATSPPEQQVIMGSAILFSPEEAERPRIITIKCRPSQVPSQGLCPQPLVGGHFSDGQAESIVLTQGLNGELLKSPLHLWYLPTALSPCAPINHAIPSLLSAGDKEELTIREWDALTWQQVGEPSGWTGHTDDINVTAIHPTGTPVAPASKDTHVHPWQLSDRRSIAIFQHPHLTEWVTFSMDDKHIFSRGIDIMISERTVLKDALPEEAPNTPAPKVFSRRFPVPALSHISSF